MNPDVIAATDLLTSRRVPLEMSGPLPPVEEEQYYRPPIDQSASGNSTPTGPWAISIAGELLGVNPQSTVFHSPSILASYVLDGLASEFPITGSTANSFDCPQIGGKVWVEIDCFTPAVGGNPARFDPTVSTGRINSGDNWPGEPGNFVYNTDDPDEPFQMRYIVPIAFIADPSSSYQGQRITVAGQDRLVVRLFDRNIGTCRTAFMDGSDALVPDDPAPVLII